MSAGIVIIPTYNEIENIERIVHAVFQLPSTFHVLIVDDNSPDGTAQKVVELQQHYAGKLFLQIEKKRKNLN
jgi:dolichol-phosphate mannosyltransferase